MVDQGGGIENSNDGGEMTVCICRESYDPRRFMLECGFCEQWFHGNCVQLTEERAFAIAKFACPPCTKLGNHTKYITQAKTIDPSLLPLPRQLAALNIKDVFSSFTVASVDKTSEKFYSKLESGMFARSGIRRISGMNATLTLFQINGFLEPILIEEAVGSVVGLQVPSSAIHVDDILSILGSNSVIKSIDTVSFEARQISYTDVTCMLSEHQADGNWSGNIEFPVVDTPLEHQVIAPSFVRELDWYHQSLVNQTIKSLNPNTIMGIYGRHTIRDFSINSSGSSCWLHLLQGLPLTVFLIPPTPAHLERFTDWQTSTTKKNVFLGDLVEKCIKCDLMPNSMMLIPAGWIYSLYVPTPSSTSMKPETTDSDTAVFILGHFFHGFNMKEQVRVLEMEQNLARKYLSPSRPVGIWPIVPAASHFLTSPSVDIVRFWIWPAVQRFILRLKSLQILTEWEKQGLLQVLPLLRQHDFPGHGDTTIDALQALLGSKDQIGSSNTSKLAKAKKTTMPTPPAVPVIVSDTVNALKRDKKVCKCHLKKCANCRNCMKRHCICVTQQPLTPANPKKNQNNGIEVKKEKQPKKKTMPSTTPGVSTESKSHTVPPISALPPSSAMAIPPWNTDDEEESLRQDVTSIWELSNDMNQSFFSGNELGINMSGTLELDDAFGIIDMVESSSLFSGYPRDDGSTITPMKEEPIQSAPNPPGHPFLFEAGHVSITGLPDSYYENEKDSTIDMKEFPGGDITPNEDGSVRHRASCHRCGNLRKKNVRCLGCPHIFCQKCAEKMVEEHGGQTFIGGCPVCKEMCCCGKNRSTVCRRKFHCYKKCPATKRCNLLSDDLLMKREEPYKDDMLMEFGIDDDVNDIDSRNIMPMPSTLVDPSRFTTTISSSLSDCEFDMELGDLDPI